MNGDLFTRMSPFARWAEVSRGHVCGADPLIWKIYGDRRKLLGLPMPTRQAAKDGEALDGLLSVRCVQVRTRRCPCGPIRAGISIENGLAELI
jgi:hypothetical protein